MRLALAGKFGRRNGRKPELSPPPMPVQVNIRHLEDDDIRLRGELPRGELELENWDELIHARRPLRYDMTVQKVGDGHAGPGQAGD